MQSVISLFAVTAALAPSAFAGAPTSCPSNSQLSCHNTTSQANTCCFNTPGGLLLQTQFWDTDPASGPSDSFTIHGLWPDNCDGTYQANCDANRAYTNITQILKSYNANSLLDYMNTYWTSNTGSAESFWEHEFGKHATCISTLDPDCYTDYKPQEEVVDFFNKTVDLFKTLNSYQLLSAAGIVPSSSKTYKLSDMQKALAAGHDGHAPYIGCSSGAIDEVWYYYNTRGNVQNGAFIATDLVGSATSCPATVKYLPKGSGGGSPTTSPGGPSPTSNPGTPFSGKGTLNVDQGGCIISGGTWYTTGTCATFTASQSGSGFTLSSSKGPCAVSGNALSCASGNSATVFGQDNGALTYSGSSTFSSPKKPSGSDQEKVSPGSGSVNIKITWSSS